MTVTAIDHDGFNSGTSRSATGFSFSLVVDNDGVGTNPTAYIADPPVESKEGQFSAQLDNAGSNKILSLTHAIGTNWITIGFTYWFEGFDSGATDIFMADNQAANMALAVKDGDLLIIDKNGTVFKTVSGALSAGRWHFFNVKYERATPGDIIVRLDNAEVFSGAASMLNAGGATLEVEWRNTTNPVVDKKHFLGEYWILSDDGADIDTNRTLGQHVIVNFSTSSGGIVSDFTGTHTAIKGGLTSTYADLESGKTFANALEAVAPEGTNFAESRGTTVKAHAVSMDLSVESGGPLNSLTKGELLGVKFTWTFKSEENQSKFAGPSTFNGLYGGNATASTDDMTEINQFGIVMTTTRANRTVYVDISDAYCPQESEFLQQGFWILNDFGTPKSGYVYGMWASCLYRPKRRVMIGGKMAEAD